MRLHILGGVVVTLWVTVALATSGQDGVTLHLAKGPSAGQVSVTWTGGTAPFSVFRSTTPVDVTTTLSYLGTTGSASWLDTPPAGSRFYYYVEPACNYNPPELCNGLDDDCDPSTLDGSQDNQVGAACDGADSDLCLEGTKSCLAGSLACSDATGSTVEVCSGNGADENCDGTVDEGFDPDTNPPCINYTNLGTISGDMGSGSLFAQGNGEAWYRVNLTENSSGVYNITAAIVLYSPPGADFDLYVRCEGCSGGTNGWSFEHSLEGHTDETFTRRNDTDRIDTFPVLIEIRNYAQSYCGTWQLIIQGNTGGVYETCRNP